MNWNFLGNGFLAILLLAPGLLLLIRFRKGRRFPWWIVILLSLILGWGCVVGASFSTTKHLESQMHAYEARGAEVPEDLMEDWASDAHGVFAVLFGWAFVIPILCAWLLAYAIAHAIRKVIRTRRLARGQPTDSAGEN